MKLSEIFNQLTFGELKQLGIGGFEQGAIQPASYREVVNHINLAMLNLYTRFPIKENFIYLRTQADKFVYQLVPANAVSSNPTSGFILDSVAAPFTGDILRVGSMYDEDGNELDVNDENAEKSIYTNAYDSIQIPYATGDELITITYRAKSKVITVPQAVATLDINQTVDLPEVLLEPLLVYVEYRVHKARGGEAGIAQANIAKQHYEMLCVDIEKRNVLRNANNTTNLKPKLNGWV